ncbi:hypothetical protein C8R44DRAFT_746260 [Mycena epipterygia]|nr:hypothetical protein C8R44DRAFT_746260 [Mycena epipterygia]
MTTKVMILAQFDHRYYIRGTLKRLTDVVAWLKAWWIRWLTDVVAWFKARWICRLTDVVAWLKAWWICIRNPCHCCLTGEEMPAKVMILAQFGHGYYICGTLKWLMGVSAWLKAWWICLSVKQVTDPKSILLLPCQRGNAHKSRDFGSVWPQILYPWDFEVADDCFGLAQGLTRNPCHCCLAEEEMPTKVMILAQFDYGYYIRGTLKRLTDVVTWLKAWWICIRNPCHCCLTGEEMPAKVMIFAQFGHGYYICGTLKWLMGVSAWLKAWWICLSVKQVTDPKYMPLLPRWGGKVVILAQFGHRYYIRGPLKWLTGVLAWLRTSWIKSPEYLV